MRHQGLMVQPSNSVPSRRSRYLVSTCVLIGALSGCGQQPLPSTASGGGGTGGASSGAGVGGSAASATGGSSGVGGGSTIGGSGGVSSGGSGGALTTGGSGGSGGVPIHPTCPGNAADAYQGMPAVVPGVVEAENFDPAGYHDATTGNEGGAYRTDVDVDVKTLGSGHAIGWMTAGEWLEYTVNVTVEGDYRIILETGAVDPGRTLALSQCETPLAQVNVPEIAEWGDIATTSVGPVHLSAGVQIIRITVGASDYLDLDSLTFEPFNDGSGGAGGGGGSGGSGGGSGGAGGGGSVKKFVGNITTGYNSSVDTNGRVFSTYWDQVTPENAGKWGSVQSTAASGFNWSALDAIYDYAQQKGIIFKQHTFVWGAQQPSGTISETNVKNWMQQFCARYPETALIDVVNEPPPHTTPSYANAIGGGTNTTWQWIINSFVWAHQYCPDAILILNDYNNIEYGDQNQHFIDIANAVLDAGAPLHALGAQAHGLSGGITASTMQNLLTKMHDDTGLPVYITEYDINLANDSEQLAKYQAHFPFFLDTEWIHGVTIWGWIHGSTWVADSGLIKNGTPRPAMTWLMDELGRPAP